jgi:hypothetical protein
VSGLLADRFPKNPLLAAGYALATLMALGIMFLPIGLGTLALIFMLGGVQVAVEETLEDSFCAELVGSCAARDGLWCAGNRERRG